MSDDHRYAASPPQLTPYPDVNAALQDLLTGIQAILGAQLIGMYLAGSLALGDFDPRNSDLDLIIVTTRMLSEETVAALRELHQGIDQSASAWAARLDAVYISQEALREQFPSDARYPIVEWPGLLGLEHLEKGWPIQRYTLREYGIRVSGPAAHSLLDPVHPDDLRQASAAIVEEWQAQANNDPEWPMWLRVRENQSFVVLTLCRLLYTLATGSVASKPAAARWVEQSLTSQWSELILHARAERHSRDEASEDVVNMTLTLLEYTYNQYQQWQASLPDMQRDATSAMDWLLNQNE